jgi:hypothetical protein
MFYHAKDSTVHFQATLGQIFDRIKSGPLPIQDAIRRAVNDKKKSSLKETSVPGFTLSGEFWKRSNDALLQHSGLLQVDIDHVGDSINTIIDQLKQSPHILAIWRSISGDGLKAAVLIPPDKDRHKDAFEAVKAHIRELGVIQKMDEQCKDAARLCFLSHDPGLWINDDAAPIKVTEKKKEKPERRPTVVITNDNLLAQATADLEAEGVKVLGEWEPEKDGAHKVEVQCPSKDHQKPKHCVAFLNQDDSLVVTCFSDECKESEVIKSLNQRLAARRSLRGWAHVVETKRFINTETLVELDTEQYNNKFKHKVKKRQTPAELALRDPAFPKYDRQIYAPTRPVCFQEKGLRYFNLYRLQIDIRPMKGDVRPFLNHITYLFPSAERQNILLDWLAWNVQRSGEKILYAILMEGAQGTGKSLFGYVMERLLGSYNVSRPSNENLHETFIDWLKHCALVIIEELMTIGRRELANKMKPMITEPNVMIREMYRPAYSQPNVCNFLMFTNHDDAIQITKDDRRYCILRASEKRRPLSHYHDLWEWVKKAENLSAILYYLRQRDLSKFNPHADAPMTEEKVALIGASAPKLQQWLKARIEEEQYPCDCDLLAVSDLTGDILPPELRGHSLNEISQILINLGARPLGQINCRDYGSGQRRLYAIRRQRFWAQQKKRNVAAEYAKQHEWMVKWALRNETTESVVRNETEERKKRPF